MTTSRIICCLALTAMLAGCSDGRSKTAAVPRPTAYPRVADPGTRYVTLDSLPVNLSMLRLQSVIRAPDGSTSAIPIYTSRSISVLHRHRPAKSRA